MATTDFHQRKQLKADAGLLFTTHIEGELMKRMRTLTSRIGSKPRAQIYRSSPTFSQGNRVNHPSQKSQPPQLGFGADPRRLLQARRRQGPRLCPQGRSPMDQRPNRSQEPRPSCRWPLPQRRPRFLCKAARTCTPLRCFRHFHHSDHYRPA